MYGTKLITIFYSDNSYYVCDEENYYRVTKDFSTLVKITQMEGTVKKNGKSMSMETEISNDGTYKLKEAPTPA